MGVKREQCLKKIIQKYSPSNQMEVKSLLKKYFDIDVTQTMISRDLQKIGAAMQLKEGKRVYVIPEKDTKWEMAALSIKDIEYNENLIVITTEPGLASFIGDLVDDSGLDILGCIAGENAVFIAPKSIKRIKSIYNELISYLKVEKLK